MAELSMAEAMQLFLKKSKLKAGIQAVQIEEVWERIMGKTVAKYTDKIQIFGTKLYVTTAIAPLKNELTYQKEKIIEMVNKELNDNVINEVIIK
jgi:hypothetical protein